MANKASIVTKNQNQIVPDTALDKVMVGHTAIGTAFIDNGELVVQKQPAAFEKGTFQEYQNEGRALAIVTIFQSMETPIDEANVQPFVEETENEDGSFTTHFAVFVEGDLSKYALPKQPQTAEKQWFEKAFLPLLKAYAEQAKGDPTIAGFMDYLRLPAMKNSLEACFEGRGVIKVFAETGEILSFSKGAASFKADWGEVSSGYSEGTFPAQETETKKKITSLFAKAKPKAEVAPAETKPAEEKKDDKTVIHQPEPTPKTETAVISSATPDPGEGKVWARPVAMIRNNDKAMKKALNHLIGGNPKGWKHMEWFAVEKTKLPAKNWEMKEETAFSAALDKAKNGKGPEITPEQMRQGMVPPKQQADFKEKFVPSVAKYTESPNLPTMEELQADENKHPTWFDKTGIHVQDTLGWPSDKVAELDRDYHALFVLRQKAIVGLLVKMMHEHPPAKKEDEQPEIAPEKTGTTEEERRQNLAKLNQDLTTKKSLFSKFRKSA